MVIVSCKKCSVIYLFFKLCKLFFFYIDFQSQNHNDYSPSISKNYSLNELSNDLPESENAAHYSSQNINENGNVNHMANNNHNNSQNEVADESAGRLSTPELNANSHEDGARKEENHFPEDDEPAPPVLNSCFDIHNSESTDSFQSEGFEAANCSQAPGNNVSEQQNSQEQNNDLVKEPPLESDGKGSNSIDADNLTLSHLKVTELEGHNDAVLSVAADQDYILSAR